VSPEYSPLIRAVVQTVYYIRQHWEYEEGPRCCSVVMDESRFSWRPLETSTSFGHSSSSPHEATGTTQSSSSKKLVSCPWRTENEEQRTTRSGEMRHIAGPAEYQRWDFLKGAGPSAPPRVVSGPRSEGNAGSCSSPHKHKTLREGPGLNGGTLGEKVLYPREGLTALCEKPVTPCPAFKHMECFLF
jgi:hypothetical protein